MSEKNNNDFQSTVEALFKGMDSFITTKTVVGDAIHIGTAMVGPISFLGLIIANIARQLLKTYRHTYLILGSALVGMVVLVAGQLVVERVYHYAVPISVFITVGGGVYFLYLLLANRRV